ncbi:uncharacterized protein LOC132946323 isoform X3 [Metopolophium dirhodum]|uniref:uncharacterized protein LOC132946323 isoform X3 n=1 Tax=Metopolophium dirhodum TaxID=44670 RepID=UPI00298FD0F6|nr:uncharacterized protein LOC132946323 isoform X3 [Metopolophium dirhodum]
MHKCVVCRNSSLRTRYTRPEVIYHTFPKNEYRKRKWLKMYGIGRCYDWHRICSDHFLEENYRPGPKRFLNKNTIPQPYNKNNEENGFPSNYTSTTQSNDVEMDNNEFLPTEQNHLSYTTQSNDVETSTNELLPREQSCLNYTTQSNDVETSTNEFLPSEQSCLSYTTQSNDVETSSNEFLPSEQSCLSYTTQSIDVETSTNELLPREQSCLSYTTQSIDVETSTNEFLPSEQSCLSYTTQSNDVETSTNEFLPREQSCLREVQNAVINNFESPRRSCRKIKLTTTNEDMSYENMPRLQTERFERHVPTFIANEKIQTVSDMVVVPVLTTTKDHTLGNGPRCSVKNCLNRYSKDLSFFGYPSNLTLRKKWIERCGLKVDDPTEKVKSNIRVCRVHFDNDCFMNTQRKNRLKTDAVPTLFLANDVIDARNIPSTSLAVNSEFIRVNKPSPIESEIYRFNKRSPVSNGFIRANKPSCSSTNYVAHMNSNETPLFVYIDSTTRSAKDFNSHCSIPGCITNTIEEVEDISLFAPRIEIVNEWSSILGFDLTINSIVCERHFRPQDILRPNLLVNGVNSQLKILAPHALPVPVMNAVPESRTYCSIPGCATNTFEEVEDISFFTPQNEDAINEWKLSVGFDFTINSTVCEKHFRSEDIVHPNLLSNGLNSKGKSLAPFAVPVTIATMVDKPLKTYCSVPECITNTIVEDEDISLFAPRIEMVDKWSSILGLELTVDSVVCERHFRPHDMLQPLVMIDGVCQNVKSLVPFSLPLPMNATPFIKQLETNDVPVLRTYDVKFKRPKPDELLCTKRIKNHVLDKSLSTTDNDTHEYNTTPDLDPTLKSNTENSVDLSIVKIEPLDDVDLETNLETEPEQLLPTLGTELVEDDDLLPLSSIDDSLSISLKTLKTISANSSLSITLEPKENSKITEPPADLFSKVSPKNALSITLRPKHNLSLTTNNSSPSVSIIPCLPSTASSSEYNVSQQSLLQYKQNATSTLKMPDKLSSNTVEIKMPVISECVSLAVQSDTDDSDSCIVIDDDDDTEEFIEKDNGFIYEISKCVELPTVFWKSEHDRSRNSTDFYQEDDLYETVKNISFNNSLMPTIQTFGKKFKFNRAIKSKNELQNLLDRIDNVEKCNGFDLVIDDNCIGYYDKITEDVISCSTCQKKFQELRKMTESQTKTTEILEQKISERTAKVLVLRENMENNKINPTPTELRPFSLINSMSVCHR